jgi:shikimate kinase
MARALSGVQENALHSLTAHRQLNSRMSIALIGYRGSGKSTVGRLLANRLRWAFADTDKRITSRAGMSIRKIFETRGEVGFRDLETDVVTEVCALNEHVIAFGGGAVLREENRTAMKDAGLKIVYLHCDAEELHKRIHADADTASSRPSLTSLGGGIDEIRNLLAVREPIYRSVMTAELDVTKLTPEEAASAIGRLV